MKIDRLSLSARVYLGLVGALVALRLLLYVVPVKFTLEQQAVSLSWLAIGVVAVLGAACVGLSPKAGFAEMWGGDISPRQRLLMPALLGSGFGLLAILLEVIQPLQRRIPQIAFPSSLVVVPMIGIFEEIIFRLVLTTLLVWLISTVILRGRAQGAVFWIVAVAVALLYTVAQFQGIATVLGTVTPWMVLMLSLVSFGFFVVMGWLYRRYGFVAAIAGRMGQYLVWHVLWGLIA